MEESDGKLEASKASESSGNKVIESLGSDFRQELASPTLTDDMIVRLRTYGQEVSVASNTILYRRGDRLIDLYVILEGGVDVIVPSGDDSRIYSSYGPREFTGEFNLLNSQGSLAVARTNTDSRLLRISRTQLQQIMRAEGDIANLIVQASIWRRIGLNKAALSGVILKGPANDADMLLFQRFFVRNMYPHRIEEVSDQDASAKEAAKEYPMVILPNGRTLRRPTIPELADELGITELPHPGLTYDVAVVGAGPSGLAAAVYAASEGLCTVVIEALAPGGQAGTSSKIENYLGFPTGIGGQQLASRAQLQALKFGVHFAISREVVTIQPIDGIHQLTMISDIKVCARAVVVATGAQYRKLNVENYAQYENRGLYYAATAMEALFCRDQEVIVVGGGNSAGQAAVFLSGVAKHVHHIIRRNSLESTMSQYLISRIENSSHITLYTDSEVVALEGEPLLDCVTWVNTKSGERTQKSIGNVFVMIGAEPNTGWLYGTVLLNDKGFIRTGRDCGEESSPYATSAPGIYAVGDVRANSVKRVASAVGEGSVVISDVHRYLADQRQHLGIEPNSALAAMRSANIPARE